MTVAEISPRDLDRLRSEGRPVELIDVRTPIEYRAVHAAPARNVPLAELDPAAVAASRTGPGSDPLYVICHSGGRGRQACERFHAAGCTNVVNVAGGTRAWAECGLPVVRGRNAVSLERQVRVAAGALVLLGCGLGAFVSPYFVALAAAVGAGLVFAGVTDTCGMGLLLARMPWNRTTGTPVAGCHVTEGGRS